MTGRRRGRPVPRPWVPMQPATPIQKTPAELERMVAQLRAEGHDDATIGLIQELNSREMWRNDRYVVMVDRDPGGGWVTTLSIRRDDRKPIRDWRHFQQIKNDIAGLDVEALELFPADDRLVDTANQYWLWCLPPGQRAPFGFKDRRVGGSSAAAPFGSVQRDP